MFIKPNPNKKVGDKALKVFDLVHQDFLPEEGRNVPDTPYWVRRLQEGDVVRCEAPDEVPQKKAATSAPQKKAAKKAKTKTTVENKE